jgi:hypothetical protein
MKTTAGSDVSDYIWLTGDEAGAILTDLAADETPLHTLLTRLRGTLSAERAHLLVEQTELRRRATAKFTQPDRMFFTRLGLEQATDEWVAAYKASRFVVRRAGASPPPSTIADLCCSIGGDLIALATHSHAIGVDLDPVAAHFAAMNSGASVEVADVRDIDLSNFAAWHIDPDRRPTGKRTTSLEFFEPETVAIDRLLQRNANAAIKLAPATVAPPNWAAQGELEWISRDRECRQLVAWHGNLARSPSRRAATVVPNEHGRPVRTVTGAPKLAIAVVPKPDRYVFDVDAAVLAAHLKGELAAEHDLTALNAGPTYLTGPRPIDEAALACFEVTDLLPFEKRLLSRHLQSHSIGRLEIKKRGVDFDPETFRRELKLRGDQAATLLVTPIAGRPAAILARRV